MNVEGFDRWIPIHISPSDQGPVVDWFRLDEAGFTQPFFADTVRDLARRPFNLVFHKRTPIEALGAIAQARPGLSLDGLIFHTSRCGSTLVTRTLSALPRMHVLSEPTPLDDVLRLRLHDPNLGEERIVQWLRWTAAVLGRAPHANQRHFVLKLDAWHANDLAVFERAFPDVPWVFLYRDPLEVLVSHARTPSLMMAASNASMLLNMPMIEAITVPRMQYCARALARIGRSVAEHPTTHADRLVNYEEFPDAIWERIAPVFGIELSARDIEAMRSSSAYHAKSPGTVFVRDAEEKRRQADGHAIEAATTWLYPLHDELEAIRHRVGATTKL